MTKDNSEVSHQIHCLSATDLTLREDAAAALFAQGAALAWPIAEGWMGDAELAALFFTEPYGNPAAIRPETTVGVAVSPENFLRIRAAYGIPAESSVPPDQDAREFELHFLPNIRMDILTSRNPAGTGAIARFLQRNGEGIQQVEFRVRDVARAEDFLHTRFGLTPVYPSIRPGANGTMMNFFLVSTHAGEKVLLELFEIPGLA